MVILFPLLGSLLGFAIQFSTFPITSSYRYSTDIPADDMDKKLLLTMQSACNSEGVNLPWDKIGQIMGDQISGGAVIQHLAKLRSRMVEQGLSVPPPLRRGGTTRISTGYSGNRASVIPVKNSARKPSALKLAKKLMSDEEDSDGDDWGSDSDGEYDRSRAKNPRLNQKVKKNNIKQEDSDNEETSRKKIGDKRKRVVSNLDTPSKAARVGRPISYKELNAGSEHEDFDSSDSENAEDGEPRVGGGASFMSLVDIIPQKGQLARKTSSKHSSLIVILHVGISDRAKAKLRSLGATPRDHVETEPISESDAIEGGNEQLVNEDEPMSLVAVQHSGETPVTFAQGNSGYGTVPVYQNFIGQGGYAGNAHSAEVGMSKGGPYTTQSMYMNPSFFNGGNSQFGSMGGAPGYGTYGDFGTNTLPLGNPFSSHGPGNHAGLPSNGSIHQSGFPNNGSNHQVVIPSNSFSHQMVLPSYVSNNEINSSSNDPHNQVDFLSNGAADFLEFQSTSAGYQQQSPSKSQQPTTVTQQSVGPDVKTASNSGPSTTMHTPNPDSTYTVGENDGSFGWEFGDFGATADDNINEFFGPFDSDGEGYNGKERSSG